MSTTDSPSTSSPQPDLSFENDVLCFGFAADARPSHFVDKRTGKDYLKEPHGPVARIKLDGKEHDATRLTSANGRLVVEFNDGEVAATIGVEARPRHFIIKVLAVEGGNVDELTFLDLHPSIGGPWAMDAPANRSSYLFTKGKLTPETVGSWIRLAQSLGFEQFDLQGCVRYGDCEPNPEAYPGGKPQLKAVIDRVHAAGMQAGVPAGQELQPGNARATGGAGRVRLVHAD
ncbi:hypothetical protein ACFLSJ_09030 [Verrucomicrobiota bacterium]